MADRSLTIRIQIDDRTEAQEDAIVNLVRERLAAFAGEPRPTLQVARASKEDVAATGGA